MFTYMPVLILANTTTRRHTPSHTPVKTQTPADSHILAHALSTNKPTDVDVPESLYLEEIRRLEGSVRSLGRAGHAEDKAADGLLKTVATWFEVLC